MSKRTLSVIESEIKETIIAYNEAMDNGNFNAMTEADSKLSELEKEYAQLAEVVCYSDLKKQENPMKAAIIAYGFNVIGHKDVKTIEKTVEDGEEKTITVTNREITIKEKQIDLIKFDSYGGKTVSVNPMWKYELQSLNQLLHRRQIAHGPEHIYILTNRVNDVVDTLLDDDHIGTVGRHFMGEPVLSGKTVGFILQAVILPQDPGTGGGPADDGGAMVPLGEAPQRQLIRPVLGGDGIAVADDGPVALLRQHGDIAEKIEQVGLSGGDDIELGIFCLVAVGIHTLGQRAAGIDHAAHEGEILQIETDLDHFPFVQRHFQGIGNHPLSCGDGNCPASAEENGIESAAVENGGFVQGNGLGAAVIVKGQPDSAAGKGNVNGIADGDIPGITLRAVLRHGHSVSPDADPVGMLFHKIDSRDFSFYYRTWAEKIPAESIAQ